ncbi:sn-glycerol 3-phosphate transport system permease protein [Naumannella halotolerans]|uniref:sn-glycerol 3-phosphate transport system permease protein n=1 Tax=Naumannella halotolerans TaxID=993414 RepID=A0A4R7J8I7_9ACTN|nr:sn-glycerol 3-phosphate transport system permease protein [Naumannella halotolerans]
MASGDPPRSEATADDRTGTSPSRRRRFGISRRNRGDFWIFLLFALPNIVLILVFSYRPILTNFYYSTLNWVLGSPIATSAGLDNYVRFFSGDRAVEVLRTTAIFTIATVGGSIVLGLGLAVVLSRPLRGRTFARASVFAPYVLSGVGIGLVWSFIFDPTIGVMAIILRKFGAASPQWFNDPDLTLVMVIIVFIWKNVGYCAVIYIAAMTAVPNDVLEAASIDGASPVRRFFSVTLPLLSPTSFFLLMTVTLASLQAFDILRIMNPLGRGTTTLMYESYLQAFLANNQAGYSAAISSILFIVLMVLTLVQLIFVERRVHYT